MSATAVSSAPPAEHPPSRATSPPHVQEREQETASRDQDQEWKPYSTRVTRGTYRRMKAYAGQNLVDMKNIVDDAVREWLDRRGG